MERNCRAARSLPDIAVVLCVLVAFAGWLASSSPARAEATGTIESHEFEAGTGTHPFIVYTPSGYSANRPAPLVVAAHGCMTTAEQFMNATRFNQVAEREGFVVAYVDVDEASAALPQPLKNCWRFYDVATWHRDQGHAAAVAGMTRAVMKLRRIDPERVYMAGTSSGGFMTAAMAAAYPDLLAAVSIVAGGGYDDGMCFGPSPGLTPVEVMAQRARQEMGSRARVVPRLVMGGDDDLGISPACADKAFFQGLRTNNLVLGDSQTAPISLKPAAIRTESNPAGYDSTVAKYQDPDGCLVGERWMILGMGHFWPGGSDDPAWSNWTDPKGPSGAEASWRFFERYTRRSTAMPCAENRAGTPKKPQCRKQRITVRVPRAKRSVRVKVNGRRVPATLRRGKVRLQLPGGKRKRTVVVVKAKDAHGKRIARRIAYLGCGPRR